MRIEDDGTLAAGVGVAVLDDCEPARSLSPSTSCRLLAGLPDMSAEGEKVIGSARRP